MGYGLLGGLLWGLDTVVLGIGLAMAPYVGTAEALAFASIVGAFLHDAFCAAWLFSPSWALAVVCAIRCGL